MEDPEGKFRVTIVLKKKHLMFSKKHWTFLKKHWTFSKIPRDVFLKNNGMFFRHILSLF